MNELAPARKLEEINRAAGNGGIRSVMIDAGYSRRADRRPGGPTIEAAANKQVRDLLFTGYRDSLRSTGIERGCVGNFKA